MHVGETARGRGLAGRRSHGVDDRGGRVGEEDEHDRGHLPDVADLGEAVALDGGQRLAAGVALLAEVEQDAAGVVDAPLTLHLLGAQRCGVDGQDAQAGNGSVRGLAVGQPVFHDRPRRAERRHRVEAQLAHHRAAPRGLPPRSDRSPSGRWCPSRVASGCPASAGSAWSGSNAVVVSNPTPTAGARLGPGTPGLAPTGAVVIGAGGGTIGSPVTPGGRVGSELPKLPGGGYDGAWAKADWVPRRTAAEKRVLRHIA